MIPFRVVDFATAERWLAPGNSGRIAMKPPPTRGLLHVALDFGTHISSFKLHKNSAATCTPHLRSLTMTEVGSERPLVLIVEDEFLIRAATADAIRDAGFEVLEAGNADEALVALETRNDIRIVFTDMRMPGSMDGAHLAHAIRRRWPPVRIMATSGKVALETAGMSGISALQ
jgi:two-component system, response regulator PdtaR